ncbi:hypothetical protein [Scopulibacillus cellulosilyticus]|uniref:Ethanolamine utilization protein n=1 Tax=Scopulibacillus cellulosilyticus TaxID=2665665 RepID=A0ABW2PTF4_9BACL
MDIREMVESVAREVIQSLKAEKEKQNRPKVLFIFCDSTAHESFTDQFIKLKNNHICHDVLFLDGETSSWLGVQRIECGGAGKVIATDENAPAPIELPKEYDGIVIPEIDLDNAARVVSGLKGTIKSEIIFSALVLQKFVLIGEDSPGIKRSDRRCLKKLSLPAYYQNKFKRYVKEMKELSITFKPQDLLADSIIDRLKEKSKVRLANASMKSKNTPSSVFQGKLLTADWVLSHSDFPDQELLVRKGTIISPLAKDLLKEKKLTVQYMNNG